MLCSLVGAAKGEGEEMQRGVHGSAADAMVRLVLDRSDVTELGGTLPNQVLNLIARRSAPKRAARNPSADASIAALIAPRRTPSLDLLMMRASTFIAYRPLL